MAYTITFSFAGDGIDSSSITAGIYSSADSTTPVVVLDPDGSTLVEQGDIGPSGYNPVTGMVTYYYLEVHPIDPVTLEGVTSDYGYEPENGTTLSFSLDGDYYYSDFGQNWFVASDKSVTLTVSALGVVVESAGPFNRLYSVDDDILTSLAAVDITTAVDPDGRDRSKYIVNLLSLPFEIPSSYETDAVNITLGDLDTSVAAPVLTTDSLVIDLGSITVVGPYGNSIDYTGVKYELILPFVDKVVSLNPSMVVGKTINVEYIIDGYSGDGTLNVYEDLVDEPFHSESISIGRTIPFRTNYEIEQDLSSVRGVVNSRLKASVRVLKSEVTDGQFDNLVRSSGVLTGVTGFVRVEEVSLAVQAPLEELIEIKGLLSQGVIIN